jgi:hypothetical protein
MKADHVVLGIHITDRFRKAGEVQALFTEFGGNIKTRLGLHEVGQGTGSPEGVVLLEIVGGDEVRKSMSQKLAAIEGIEVKEMVFSHT